MSGKDENKGRNEDLVIENIDHLLGTMADDNILKETFNKEKNEHEYSLTLKGELQGLKLLETDEGVLYFWEIMMKMLHDKIPNQYERFLKCAEILRDEMGINLLRVIERNEDRIQGFSTKSKGDDYKKFVKHFDPIGVYHGDKYG